MILRVDLEWAGTLQEGFLALHRVGDCWVAIDNVADATVEQAIGRCRDEICGWLDRLSELAMHEAERGGLGESPDRQSLIMAQWHGIELVREAVHRLWDEPDESESVLLPEFVVFAPVTARRGEPPGDDDDHVEE